MKVNVEYWNPKNETIITESGFRYLDTTPTITKVESWSGTKEEIFKRFNKQNNCLRYCNGSFYKFEDNAVQAEYQKWYKSLSESTKFQIYYGNGVVD